MTPTTAVTAALVIALAASPAAAAPAQATKRGSPAAGRSTPPSPAAQTPKPTSPRISPQGFSVVLVVADLQAASGQDDVPPAARKALADMRDFLPYKSYKLLDAAWLLGHGSGGNVTRLRGLEEQEYELRLVTQPTAGPGEGASRVFVRFTLTDSTHEASAEVRAEHEGAAAAEIERQSAALRAELNRARAEVEKTKQSLGGQHPEVKAAEREIQRLQSEVAASTAISQRRSSTSRSMSRSGSRSVIDTSFTMDVGETVVVGTSRLKGNSKALIALLTAVPPKGRM